MQYNSNRNYLFQIHIIAMRKKEDNCHFEILICSKNKYEISNRIEGTNQQVSAVSWILHK